MSNSLNLELPYLAAAQSQKHVTVNEALRRLDAAIQLSVIDQTHTAPPQSPSEGDRYIVAVNPTDAWEGHAYKIAAYIDGAWIFFEPKQGWLAYVSDEHGLYIFNGASWQLVTELNGFDTTAQFGVNASADENNRLVVKAAASLFAADNGDGSNGDVRVVLSKSDSTDTASHLFQNEFSDRAELGLIGSDDFSIKVSPDGATFLEAMTVSSNDGAVNFLELPTVGGDTLLPVSVRSRQRATALEYSPDVQCLETRGYSTENDGGGARYFSVPSEPSHPGKFQSADGRWWEVDARSAPLRAYTGQADAGATVVNGRAFFRTRNEAAATSLSQAISYVETRGHNTEGDGRAGVYERRASQPTRGTFFQSADGAYWAGIGVPLLKADVLNLNDTIEINEQMLADWGPLAIHDRVDISERQNAFMVRRIVEDVDTASYDDHGTGEFTQPAGLYVDMQLNGNTDKFRAARLINARIEDNTNKWSTLMNLAAIHGGSFTGGPADTDHGTVWGIVIEGYDTSARALQTPGDCDQNPLADIEGSEYNTYIGMEINHKMKKNSIFVGMQILPNTYGRVVSESGGVRPKAQRCISIGPGRDGGDGLPGSYLNEKTGADIDRCIDFLVQAPAHAGEPGAATSDYGLWGRLPFEKAFAALAQTDKIVFDNDKGENVFIRSPANNEFAVSVDGGSKDHLTVTTGQVTLNQKASIDGAAGTRRTLTFRSNGSERWHLRTNNAAESGANAGSDLELVALSDNGTTENALLTFDRSTRDTRFHQRVLYTGDGNLCADNNLNLYIDQDNSSTNSTFNVYADGNTAASAERLFAVNSIGSATIYGRNGYGSSVKIGHGRSDNQAASIEFYTNGSSGEVATARLSRAGGTNTALTLENLAGNGDVRINHASSSGAVELQITDENILRVRGNRVDMYRTVYFPSYTAAQIADSSHTVNTVGKSSGGVIRNSSNNVLMIALGGSTTSGWKNQVDGSIITPS